MNMMNKELKTMQIAYNAAEIASQLLTKCIQNDGSLRYMTTDDIAKRSVRMANAIWDEIEKQESNKPTI